MRSFSIFAIAVLALAACSDPTGSRERPGIEFVSGHQLTDTAGAIPADSLVVLVRDEKGQPLPGVEVRFNGWARQDAVPVLFFTSPTFATSEHYDSTDATGRAGGRMRLPHLSGEAAISVDVRTRGYTASTTITVLPGAAVALQVAPLDSATTVGGSYALRTQVTDRYGNPRTDPVVFQVRGTAATVAGGRVTGVGFGVVRVVATAGGIADSTHVSVVPPGTLAGIRVSTASGEPGRLMTFSTDGSQRTELPQNPTLCIYRGLQWRPGGGSLVLSGATFSVGCHYAHLYKASTAAAAQPLAVSATPQFLEERWPRFDAAGEWIYFSGRPGHANGEIWRMRPDGGQAQRVGPAAGFEDVDEFPSPSPDGTRVAYTSNRVLGTSMLRILDLTTGATQPLGLHGTAVSWSPDGQLLAFAQGDQYYVVRPDGSGLRAIAPRVHTYSDDVPAWSADSRWLAVTVPDPRGYAPIYGRIALVDVQTGAVLPLGWTSQMTHPAWKP